MLWSSLGVKWQKNLLPLSAGAVSLFLWEGRLRIDTGVVVEGGVPGLPSHGEVALITLLRPWGLTVYRQLARYSPGGISRGDASAIVIPVGDKKVTNRFCQQGELSDLSFSPPPESSPRLPDSPFKPLIHQFRIPFLFFWLYLRSQLLWAGFSLVVMPGFHSMWVLNSLNRD